MIRRAVLAAVAALFVFGPMPLFAQDASRIAGHVRDASGGAIPGATVHVVNDSAGVNLDVVTDAQGSYQTDSLAPGRYRVTVALDGFESAAREVVVAADREAPVADLTLQTARLQEGLVVTARRVEEVAQDVPIPLTVVGGRLVENAGAFNVNRLKDLVPTVQFYSSNPRNSSVNIRGLGAPFGLTNDGLEAGVGLYVDGVFYARPASATLDFLDVEQIEVLRGPQGTLFGKNTTAGAINVTTRKPSFTRGADFEASYGDLSFLQTKASVTTPFNDRLSARVSFSGTNRHGTVRNVATDQDVNDLNNLGVRGQLLYAPSDNFAVTWAADYTRQRPEGYTQVYAGVAPTLRPANRQYAQIAADLNYAVPSTNAFDRVTDVDSPLRSYQDLGGTSLNLESKLGRGRLTSTTAWRSWNWNPSSDRDFIGLPVTTISAAPSKQRQWTQEVRYAADVTRRLKYVAGAFAFHQSIVSNPTFQQEQGSAAARFLLAPTQAALTPGLLDGYGYNQFVDYGNTSAALFGQLDWAVSDRLRILPGLRVNYDRKDVDFDQQVYGGLQTTDPVLLALKLSVLAPQAYTVDVDDTNVSGQLTAHYRLSRAASAYATYATGFKSVGLNLNGLPTDALGNPILSTAVVKPEDTHNIEVGVKTEIVRGVTANVSAYNTTIEDFQTQVTNASVGVLRGYLANADKVRVRGIEFDANARVGDTWTLYVAGALTDGVYVSFPDAPPPLEETGGPQVKDISGEPLPGISRWAFSVGAEFTATPRTLFGEQAQFFAGADASYRSSFSSSATASTYLVVDGYSLLNARAGVRLGTGWTLFVWSRNLLNTNYYELLTAAPGNTGLYVGQPADARRIGVTLRVGLKSR